MLRGDGLLTEVMKGRVKGKTRAGKPRKEIVSGSSLHAHNTRHSDCFILKANCNPKSIIFTGPSLWAKLPTHLQSDPSPTSFLKHYKDFLSSKL